MGSVFCMRCTALSMSIFTFSHMPWPTENHSQKPVLFPTFSFWLLYEINWIISASFFILVHRYILKTSVVCALSKLTLKMRYLSFFYFLWGRGFENWGIVVSRSFCHLMPVCLTRIEHNAVPPILAHCTNFWLISPIYQEMKVCYLWYKCRSLYNLVSQRA